MIVPTPYGILTGIREAAIYTVDRLQGRTGHKKLVHSKIIVRFATEDFFLLVTRDVVTVVSMGTVVISPLRTVQDS